MTTIIIVGAVFVFLCLIGFAFHLPSGGEQAEDNQDMREFRARIHGGQ